MQQSRKVYSEMDYQNFHTCYDIKYLSNGFVLPRGYQEIV